MDRRDISMLYIKDQQVETVKQTEKDDEKWKVRMKKYADAMKEGLKK